MPPCWAVWPAWPRPLPRYCAVSGRFDAGALLLLLIFSLWQMPHCYAIAIFRRDDYAAADIPVVPVTRGIPAAKRHIMGYAGAFVAATLMLTFGGYTGYGYLAVAVILGLFWLVPDVVGLQSERRQADGQGSCLPFPL